MAPKTPFCGAAAADWMLMADAHSSGDARLARLRHANARLRIIPQLVAQGADGDAENIGRVGAVAQAMIERVEDEVALYIRDRTADQVARGGHRGGGRER